MSSLLRQSWASRIEGALTEKYRDQGKDGRRDHLTLEERGTVPIDVVRNMLGVMGETPGAHRNKHGQAWEDFKSDIKANGIKEPILITIDWGEAPRISEGNHRRDAAVELGLEEVPAHVRYFGNADKQGKLLERTHKTAVFTPAAAIVQWWNPEDPWDSGVRNCCMDHYPILLLEKKAAGYETALTPHMVGTDTPCSICRDSNTKEASRIRLWRSSEWSQTLCPKCYRSALGRDPDEMVGGHWYPLMTEDFPPGSIEVCSECGRTIVNSLPRDGMDF